MSSFDIAGGLRNLKGGPLDTLRGPYVSLTAANLAIPNVLVDGVNFREGKQVDIVDSEGIYITYWWQQGYEDENLTPILIKGDKGDPFVYSDFTPEQITDLKQPAIDAAVVANTAASNANDKATLANNAAINADNKANLANTATNNANTATTNANNAATNANDKAALAQTAATNANNATSNTNTAISQANTARDNANTAASSANTATSNANTATSEANDARDEALAAAIVANSARGWQPEYGLESDGATREVQKLIRWVGGTGSTPIDYVGKYIGSTGFVDTKAEATNIKGNTGVQGIQGIQGIQGEKGDTGEQGVQGIQGPIGLTTPNMNTGKVLGRNTAGVGTPEELTPVGLTLIGDKVYNGSTISGAAAFNSTPAGGVWYGSSSTTGSIEIEVPNVITMFSFKGVIFFRDTNNGTNRTCEFLISAYPNDIETGNSAVFTGTNAPKFPVRWHVDGAKRYVYIGDLTQTWSYSSFTIQAIVGTFNAPTLSAITSGWAINLVTAFKGTQSAIKTETLPRPSLAYAVSDYVAASGVNTPLTNAMNPLQMFQNLQKQNDNRYTKVESQQLVDGIKIGGRNYQPNSEIRTLTGFTTAGNAPTLVIENVNELRISGINASYIFSPNFIEPIPSNETVTLSFWVKNNSAIPMSLVVTPNGNVVISNTNIAASQGWTKVTGTGVVSNLIVGTHLYTIVFECYTASTFDISIKHIKIEKGNKATDWTPAPEDVQTAIDADKPLTSLAVSAYNAASGTDTPLTNAMSPTQMFQNLQKQNDNRYTKAESQQLVDDLKIGGRNLVKASKATYIGTSQIQTYYLSEPLIVGETYTATLNGISGVGATFRIWVNYASQAAVQLTKDDGVDTVSAAFVYGGATDEYRITVYSENSVNPSTINWVKIEKGNKASDWSPAPEDLDNLTHPITGYNPASGVNTPLTNAMSPVQMFQNLQKQLTDGDPTKLGINGKSSVGLQLGRSFYNVLDFEVSSSVNEIVIKTKIPFGSGSGMPVIHLYGYAYGNATPIELKVAFYVYLEDFINVGATSLGAWKPDVKLFTYVDAGTTYVALALVGSIYYPRFTINFLDIWNSTSRDFSMGWSVETSLSTTIEGTDNLITVPYKQSYDRTDIGLPNVDNTADSAKPVSTAQQTAIDAKVADDLTASTTVAPSKTAVNTALALKADIASPTFTGTPSLPTGTTAVTQTAGDNSTKLATTAYVKTAVDAIGSVTLLKGSTTVNGTDVSTNRYKDITVTGAAIGDVVNIDDQFRLLAADFPFWISAKVTATNTVRIYFSNLQFTFNAGTTDAYSTLSVYTGKSIENPSVLAWTINYTIIK